MISNNQTNAPRQPGFTLIELLIVIVVIAVLAAISTVAYNGIQNRAHLNKVTTSVNATIKLLEMYRTEHGEYPDSQGKYYCIGTVSNFPENAPFDAGACNYWNGGDSYFARVNSDFNNELLQYASSVPDGGVPTAAEGPDGYSQRGLFYFRNNFSGEAYLTYGIAGDRDCHIGEKRNWYVGMTTCEVILDSE